MDIRFAPDDTVSDLETAVTDESGCTDSGICLGQWPRELALYAEPNSNDETNQTTQGLCTVYAYLASEGSASDLLLPLGDSLALRLDVDQTVWWIQPEDFISVDLEPGTRRFWAISQNDLMDSLKWSDDERGWSDEEMAAAPWVSTDVECGPDEVRYFEMSYSKDGRQQILEVEDVHGRQEIAKRRELVSMYAGEFPFVQPVTPSVKP